jgi:hypothetical protein
VTEVKVTAKDFKFVLSKKTAKRGIVVFKVTNLGAVRSPELGGLPPAASRARFRRTVSTVLDTHGVAAEDGPPICARCGVTMVPAALSASEDPHGEWVCLECEEFNRSE